MTPCWKHLLNLKYDSDPLFYLKVHEIDITTSIVRDREIDGRWEKLKSRIEQEILDLCDKVGDKTVREICAEQDAMMRIQEIMKEIER